MSSQHNKPAEADADAIEPLPEPAYIIPRPGPEPMFILGGTYLRDDYYTVTDPATGERILREYKALMKDFIKPSVTGGPDG